MSGLGRELARAVLLFSIVSILSGTNEQSSAAETALLKRDGVVVTKEVLEKIERADYQGRPSAIGGETWMPSPLLTPADFPILTVNVDPNEPPDFVVAINGNSYQAGSRSFRVDIGKVTIIVVRQGKSPCQHTLDVTQTGPNSVSCKF